MNRLRKLRNEKNLTQECLAFELGTNQQKISELECGVSMFKEDLLIRTVQFFGVSADYLLGLSDIRLEFEMEEIHPERLNQTRLRELLYYFSRMDNKTQDTLLHIEKELFQYSTSIKKERKQSF